jgi:putative tryptophan/tyrosine transport system substrate-binding protein
MLHSYMQTEAVAPSLGTTATAIDVLDGGGIERAVGTFASQPDGGLIVMPNRYNLANRGTIIILAARYRLPAIYPFRFFAIEGGLISHGFDLIEQWRGPSISTDQLFEISCDKARHVARDRIQSVSLARTACLAIS